MATRVDPITDDFFRQAQSKLAQNLTDDQRQNIPSSQRQNMTSQNSYSSSNLSQMTLGDVKSKILGINPWIIAAVLFVIIVVLMMGMSGMTAVIVVGIAIAVAFALHYFKILS